MILAASQADGPALANSTVATSILHASGKCTLQAGALQVGSTIKHTIHGRISTVVTTPGTLTFDLRLNGIVVSALGALNLNTTAQTNSAFELILLTTIRALGTGTGAQAFVTGVFTSRALVGSPAVTAGSAGTCMLPDTAPAVGVNGFDSTLALPMDVFATWSIANASNSSQVHQSVAEIKV